MHTPNPTVNAVVPKPLQAHLSRWRAEGKPRQPGMAWPRERWIRLFPDQRDALHALPDLLDRDIVRRACEAAAADDASAQRAFLAVMAWGYGETVGYGPWRAHRVLTDTPDAAARLASVARTLYQEGPLDAYRRLASDGDCTLRWLGPAFGTKYLYFCPPGPHVLRALILDSLVAEWLRDEVALDLNPVPWSQPIYRRYLEHIHQWATALECAPDDVEYCIFREMASRRNNQWSSS